MSTGSGGFTLVESAIALALVALTIAAFLPAVAMQRDVRLEQASYAQLEEVRAALVGFAVAHRRLPCPAQAGAGVEIECRGEGPDDEVVAGTLPWRALGVGEVDPWGRRLFYVVARRWTSELPAIAGPITVKQRSDRIGAPEPPGVLPIAAADVVAVVVSAGKNGHWAYAGTGAARAHPTLDASSDEGINAHMSGSAKVFIAGAPRTGARSCSDRTGPSLCEFDDLVVALTRGVLAARTGRTTSTEGR